MSTLPPTSDPSPRAPLLWMNDLLADLDSPSTAWAETECTKDDVFGTVEAVEGRKEEAELTSRSFLARISGPGVASRAHVLGLLSTSQRNKLHRQRSSRPLGRTSAQKSQHPYLLAHRSDPVFPVQTTNPVITREITCIT